MEIFQRKPYLKNYFSNLEESSIICEDNNYYVTLKDSPYSLRRTRSGSSIVYFQEKPLASIYNSDKQADRILQSIPYSNRDLLVVFGMGNPSLLTKVHDSCPSNQIILFIDIAEDLIPILWDSTLDSILTVPGRHVFSGESFIPLLFNYLDGLGAERMSGVKFFKNSDSIRLAPEFYNGLEETISTLFSAKMSDLLTKFEFENLWISNIVSNTIRYTPDQFQKIATLEGILKGTPGVLVSAGPSLRSQVPYLHEYRDKVFVMACDTALKVLLKNRIVPDAVFTLDAQMNSLFHFLGEDLTYIPCFADMVSSPYLLENLNAPITILSMTSKFIHKPEGVLEREITAGGEFAEKYLGVIGDIQSGGSVATTAFEALRHMGVREFFFLGQDLAYTGREIHSTGTHHNEKWLCSLNRKKSLELINEAVVRKRDTRYVESTRGGEVLTDFVLDLYRSWFEDSVSTLRKEDEKYRFVNFSDRGAKIHGMENLSIQESISIFDKYPNHTYPWKNILIPGQSLKDKIEMTIPDPQDRRSTLFDDLNGLFLLLRNIERSDNWETESREWFESRPYLRRILRKTEVYINRHRDTLSADRIKNLYLRTLHREFKRLKRKFYPILGPEFLGGESLFRS